MKSFQANLELTTIETRLSISKPSEELLHYNTTQLIDGTALFQHGRKSSFLYWDMKRAPFSSLQISFMVNEEGKTDVDLIPFDCDLTTYVLKDVTKILKRESR